MALLALPLAFAGAGFLGFGQIGAAVGWLVGAWLFGPKATSDNQIFDPGAEEMPRFNQSLRGVTMPVIFGTNRVTSNTVWTNHWQTIRKETAAPQQGGGKGGGSGMGGKGGGQSTSTQVSYEYKWDMLFHIGMTPEPYGLFGGWANTQRISGDTILQIINNSQGLPPISNTDPRAASYNITPNNSNKQNQNNIASLSFDASFFGPAGPTHGNYPAWDYFAAQTGTGRRWPYTVYVGFQALSLGSSAAVPQLQWEVGPGGASLARSPTWLSGIKHSAVATYCNSIIKDSTTGKHYQDVPPDTGGIAGDNLNLWCLEDGTTIQVPYTDLPAGVTGILGAHKGVCGGSNYVAYLGFGSQAANTEVKANFYQLDNGALTVLSSFARLANTGQEDALNLMVLKGFTFMSFDGIMKTNSGFPTWVVERTWAGSNRIKLFVMPFQASPNTLYPRPDVVYTDYGVINISGEGEGLLSIPDGTVFSDNQNCAFFLPWYDPHNSPIINNKWPIGYYLCIYVSPGKIAAYNAGGTSPSPIMATYASQYPNGFIIGWRLTGNDTTLGGGGRVDLTVDAPIIMNSKFQDASGVALTSFFDDSGENIDGTANAFNQYQVAGLTNIENGANAGGIILTFAKLYQSTTDLAANQGSYSKLRVFAWNPASEVAKEYAESEGTWVTAAQIGYAYTGTANSVGSHNLYYDPADSKIYFTGNYVSSQAFGGWSGSIAGSTQAVNWGPLTIGGGSDVPVAYIVYQILTNPVFGAGIDTLNIDSTTYALALQYCLANNIEVSVVYTREESLLSAIEDLLAIMGGYLIDSGGNVRFGLQKFTSSPVRVIDNDHLVVTKQGEPPVRVTKGALVDGFNKVRVNYLDRNLDYRQNQVEVGDEVDQDINGVRFKEFPPKFVMNAQLAADVAERALWTNLYARDTFEFKLGWKDADLEPGDVITLVDTFHPELQPPGKTVRIANWNERVRGQFSVRGVEEIAEYMSASHSFDYVNSAGPSKPTSDPLLPMRDFWAYELPREFQASGAYLFFGYNQQSNIRGATLWLSPDGVTYSIATNAEPYIISGQFAQALPAQSPGNRERDIELYILTASGFTTSTPTFCSTFALDDITEAMRASGGGLLYCGSEMLAMENLTLLGQNHYRVGNLYRGWGGTLSQAHASGDLFHRHGSGIFFQEVSTDKIGTNLYYKIVPYNFSGEAYDVSSINGKSYAIRGAYWLPQVQSDLRVYVSNALDGLSSVDMRGNYARAVWSGGADATVQWSDTARLEGYGTAGYGKLGYGHFTADADAHVWRVEVIHGGTVVRSTAVSTPSYTYTALANSADNAGFASLFQFRVTPHNGFGDAPFGCVRSLNLFTAPIDYSFSSRRISFDATSVHWDKR